LKARSLRKKQVVKYVCRRQEPKKRYRRRSTFGVGLDGEKWVNYLEQFSLEVEQLMKLTPNKRRFYQQGMRAATLPTVYLLGLFVTPPERKTRPHSTRNEAIRLRYAGIRGSNGSN